MVTMWAAAMYMQGAFTTYDNPITRWNAVINSPARFYKVRKRKKPPDKDPGTPLADYGARLRWLHKQNIHTYWRISNYLVVDPVDEAPDIPDFCWGNCPHSCKACHRQRKKILSGYRRHFVMAITKCRRQPGSATTIPGYRRHFVMAITKCRRQPGSGTVPGYRRHFVMAITKCRR